MDGGRPGGTLRNQIFSYDPFGNLLAIGGSSARNTPTAPAINHLTGATYDDSGNVITWNGNSYSYDPFHLMWDYHTASDEWIYLYTADDERAWSYKTDNTSLWTLRGLDGKVLREYTTSPTWSVAEDYVYRNGLLLAAETPAGTRQFHLDHLGTPRLVSNNLGQQAAYHVYYPYGEEATAFNQDTVREKFTGHERDLGNPGGPGDDLDYMHARFCSPLVGRFMSMDPALESVEPKAPQTWNRFNYVADNPLKYVDPTGEILYFFGSANDIAQLQQVANQALYGVDLVVDQNGKANLVPNNETGQASSEQLAFASTLSSAINRPNSINIGVVKGDSGVLFGSYSSGKIDIKDIAAAGGGNAVNSAALLAHEVAEQTAKQTLGLGNNEAGFNQAHQLGLAAQQAVSGYRFISQTRHLDQHNTGTVTGVHRKGSSIVAVTFQFVNGDLARITRRP